MAINQRDDFSKKVKDLLARRVGYKCSICFHTTIGPTTSPEGSLSTGEAAHITSASPGGPRYNPNLTPEQRKGYENGIWVCSECAHIIDNDKPLTPEAKIRQWKTKAEEAQRDEHQGSAQYGSFGQTILSTYVERGLKEQVEELGAYAESTLETELKELRIRWTKGEHNDVLVALNAKRTDPNQASRIEAAPQIKAQFRRFEASIRLHEEDGIEKATKLMNEAKSIDPEIDLRKLKSLITLYSGGPRAAAEAFQPDDDLDSINLSASFLLFQQQPSEALRLLSLEGTSLEPDAETLRLKALACIQPLLIRQARIVIDTAEKKFPLSFDVKIASAMIKYYSSISPEGLGDGFSGWPTPVEQIFFKRESESIQDLNEAARIFHEAADNPSVMSNLKESYRIWELASLYSIPGKEEDAKTICKDVLDSNPTNYQALIWALVRGWEIDYTKSEIAILNLIEKGTAQPSHIVYLVQVLIHNKKNSQALTLLKKHRSLFFGNSAQITWYFWVTFAIVDRRHPRYASVFISSAEVGQWTQMARELLLDFEAKESKDWSRRIVALESAFVATRQGAILLRLCTIKGEIDDWNYVADRATELIQIIGTSGALEYAVRAFIKVKRFQDVITAIDTNLNLLLDLKLTHDLRQCRAQSNVYLKNYPEALSDLVELSKDPSVENLHNLFLAQHATGDHIGEIETGRRILANPKTDALEALRTSHALLPIDKKLSSELWERAHGMGVPDEGVQAAYMLANQLDRQDEAVDLSRRLFDNSKSDVFGLHMLPGKELPEIFSKARDHSMEMHRMYRAGRIPVHFLPKELNSTLADFYHFRLRMNERHANPAQTYPLMVRHGGRPEVTKATFELSKLRLHIDITTILLSGHIGVIGEIERNFTPIYIIGDTITLLQSMIAKQQHHQIKQVTNAQAVQKLVEKEKIKVIPFDCELPEEILKFTADLHTTDLEMIYLAKQNGGYVHHFLPLTKKDYSGEPVPIPEELSEVLVDSRQILESLRRNGPLSQERYVTALRNSYDTTTLDELRFIPLQRKPLYTTRIILSQLEDLSILEDTCDRFEVFLDKQDFETLKAEVSNTIEYMQDSFLKDTSRRISEGLGTGLYKIAKSRPTHPEDVQERDLNFNALIELNRTEWGTEDVLCIDDRFVNAYMTCEPKTPIIDTFEIVSYLHASSKISFGRYLELMHSMRAANVRFIPLSKGELLHHANTAIIREGAIIESKEMTMLRSYYNSVLEYPNMMQTQPFPADAPNFRDEMPFVVNLLETIEAVSKEIRSNSERSEIDKAALVEWVSSINSKA